MAILAQGPLNPPGAPAATMKTLDQIEPRKEVNATNTPGDAAAAFVISQPGSYYLSGNISGVGEKSGIRIDASNVTLDLNGFAIVGELLAQTRGIQVPNAFLNVHIRNGSVRNWPRGIDATGSGNVFETLRVTNNGSSGGLQAGARAQVNNCTFLDNAGAGVSTGDAALIRGCTVAGNAARGIVTGVAATITDCQVTGNVSAGIEADDGSTIANCAARGNNGIGIITGDFSTITNSTAFENTGDGFFVRDAGSATSTGQGSTVIGCTAAANGANGFFIAGGGSTISSCTSQLNGTNGFSLAFGASITRSNARRNGLDGIRCLRQSVVMDNLAAENGTAAAGGAGIYVQSGQGSRIDNNNVVENDRGIEVAETRNIIMRNTARNNGGRNYVIAAGNRIAQIIVPPTNSAIDGDDPSATGDFTSTDPWANFSY